MSDDLEELLKEVMAHIFANCIEHIKVTLGEACAQILKMSMERDN